MAGQSAPTEPDAGLAHLGNGRFYDPLLARPLQPNPVGGPPTMPQALNRYAVTSVGQPGVMEAAASSSGCLNHLLCDVILTNAVGLGVGEVNNLRAFNDVHVLLNRLETGRVKYTPQPRRHRPRIEFEMFSFTPRKLDLKISYGYEVIIQVPTKSILSAPTPWGKIGEKFGHGLDKALPFVIDAGLQLWQDWNNPYLTPERRLLRAGTATLGDVLGGMAAGGVAAFITANPPVLLVLGIGG